MLVSGDEDATSSWPDSRQGSASPVATHELKMTHPSAAVTRSLVALTTLLAVTLQRGSCEPQQKFPEDFYSDFGSATPSSRPPSRPPSINPFAANVALEFGLDPPHTSPSDFHDDSDFPPHDESLHGSGLDFRLLYDVMMNDSSPSGPKQHANGDRGGRRREGRGEGGGSSMRASCQKASAKESDSRRYAVLSGLGIGAYRLGILFLFPEQPFPSMGCEEQGFLLCPSILGLVSSILTSVIYYVNKKSIYCLTLSHSIHTSDVRPFSSLIRLSLSRSDPAEVLVQE